MALLKSDIDRLHSQLRKQQDKNAAHEDKFVEQAGILREVQDRLDLRVRDNEELQATLATAKAQHERLQIDLAAQQDIVRARSDQVEELEKELAGLKERLDQEIDDKERLLRDKEETLRQLADAR